MFCYKRQAVQLHERLRDYSFFLTCLHDPQKPIANIGPHYRYGLKLDNQGYG